MNPRKSYSTIRAKALSLYTNTIKPLFTGATLGDGSSVDRRDAQDALLFRAWKWENRGLSLVQILDNGRIEREGCEAASEMRYEGYEDTGSFGGEVCSRSDMYAGADLEGHPIGVDFMTMKPRLRSSLRSQVFSLFYLSQFPEGLNPQPGVYANREEFIIRTEGPFYRSDRRLEAYRSPKEIMPLPDSFFETRPRKK